MGWPTVVYDECAADVHSLSSSNALRLVLFALDEMGKESFVLEGTYSLSLAFKSFCCFCCYVFCFVFPFFLVSIPASDLCFVVRQQY